MYYIWHGDEEFSRAEAVADLKERIMGAGMGDLNITYFDGRKVSLDELINACNTIPFLSDKRLVIVEDLLQRFVGQKRSRKPGQDDAPDDASSEPADSALPASAKEDLQKLLDYLPHLPEPTRLVFVETRTLGTSHPVLQAAAKQVAAKDKGVHIRKFSPLGKEELHDWVRARAQKKQANITREAADLLILLVGAHLRALDQELTKLAAYVNYARAIGVEDVQLMVSNSHEATIFALVDALGMRESGQAMHTLQELLAGGENELYILTMIARQFRLILGVKDLMGKQQSTAEIRHRLHISKDFILNKLMAQARHFQQEELEALHQRVLEMDRAIKTGRIEARLALELLVIDACNRPTRSSPSTVRQNAARQNAALSPGGRRA